MRWQAVAAVVLAATAACPLSAQDDPIFDARWESLRAGGYEPLTIPVDWYDPVARVEGNPTLPRTIGATQAGLSPAAIAAASAWAEAQNSTALLVARNGDIAFERYWQSTGRDTRFNPQSMSKTVLAMLVGIAIERGVIASVNDPIERYLEEWRGDERGQITLQHMLWMSSGLEQGDASHGYMVTPDNPIVRHSLGSDFTKLLLSLQPVGEPGGTFDYNNQVNQLLSLVLERASGREYEDLLSEWLWLPLGLADAALPLDREGGMVLSSCCILSRPIDWLRIGALFVTGGRHAGKQIVPERWIAAMLEPSPAFPGYGYQVWVGDQRVGGDRPPKVPLMPWQSEPFAAPQVVILHGHGGQRTYIMPDKQLVIVRAARDWPDAWDDAVLPNVIWRGATEHGESE
ncbi:serine hydrolase domain-containing protein [Erythrobacter sp.]|uniref:serine hydrolase domain-containing protein n=1 Tax=Erythrobacter sp. TaxID=1042 RepID=UPI003C726EBA